MGNSKGKWGTFLGGLLPARVRSWRASTRAQTVINKCQCAQDDINQRWNVSAFIAKNIIPLSIISAQNYVSGGNTDKI